MKPTIVLCLTIDGRSTDQNGFFACHITCPADQRFNEPAVLREVTTGSIIRDRKPVLVRILEDQTGKIFIA